MGAQGAFTFVLHSHLPYARLAGRWPHGEEWIHEAASETYLPLLNALYDLKERGIRYKLTLGITPTLAEQLTDPLVLEHFDDYLEMRLTAAQKDMGLFAPEQGEIKSYANPYEAINQDEHAFQRNIAEMAVYSPVPLEITEPTQPHMAALARWYYDWYSSVKRLFNERFKRDIIGAFRQLQDEGYIEIITCAATHAYLPLLSRDSSIIAQLKVGIQTHERLFGKRPTGIWLPECAYRPAYEDEAGTLRPGIEHFLAQEGIKVFFVETHTITGGQPVGVANGDIIGPYGAVKRRYVVPASPQPMPQRTATTFEGYYVSDSGAAGQVNHNSGVAAIGRNNETGHQVWSSQIGYPGDFDYREFHKKAGTSGLQYWRVSGDRVDLGNKDLYHPDWADIKVDQHAEHFAHMVGDLLRDYHEHTGNYGILASNFDTELFGHWWFEGINWLAKVIQHLAASPEIDMMTASEYITQHPPQTTLHLPESSWGAGGTHFTWDNSETHWMWEPIHECEGIMEDLVVRFGTARADEEIVLKQAARELLLMQSSDWPFLVTTGQAREYAIQRFSQHLERFKQLADSLLNGSPDVAYATNLYELDKVFADIDYRWFKPA